MADPADEDEDDEERQAAPPEPADADGSDREEGSGGHEAEEDSAETSPEDEAGDGTEGKAGGSEEGEGDEGDGEEDSAETPTEDEADEGTDEVGDGSEDGESDGGTDESAGDASEETEAEEGDAEADSEGTPAGDEGGESSGEDEGDQSQAADGPDQPTTEADAEDEGHADDEPEGSGRFLDYDELPERFKTDDGEEDRGSDYDGSMFKGTGRNPNEDRSEWSRAEGYPSDEEEADGAVTEDESTGFGGLSDTGEHAPDDEEQPLEAHVTEMVYRFLAVALVIAGIGAIALLWSDDLINFLWYSFLGPGAPACPGNECPQMFQPHLYHPLSLVLARLKISVLVGFIVGLPVAVYQTYLFMRPGLYPHERRYYLAAVPTSLVLATVGVAFAYFLILPALFSYFVGYTTRAAEPALGLAETFNIMVILLGFFALVFQIPLFVMLAIMMGVTTRRWLEDRRLYFWMGFGGVAFIFSPDPTGMAPLLVALTMIGLFEGTLALLRWTGEDSPILAPAPLRARRPYAWLVAAIAGYAASGAPLPASYFEQLPPIVISTLADLGWTAGTPLIVAGAIVVGFEVLRYLLRRVGVGLRAQLWILRARWPVWIVAAIVGYLASPSPGLLAAARETSIQVPWVLAIVLGIAVGYEVLIQLVVWRRSQ